MFRLGRQVESALLAIRAIDEMDGKETPISDICLKFGLSRNTLAKVMQSLSAQNIVESTQGTRGGYKLSSSLDKISFFQVLEALGEIKNLKCRHGESCSLSGNCSISSPLIKWELNFENHLKSTFLSELLYDKSSTPAARSHL